MTTFNGLNQAQVLNQVRASLEGLPRDASSETVVSSFDPLVQWVGGVLARDGYSPFDPHHRFDWFSRAERDSGQWIKTFREQVREWKLRDFQGEQPGDATVRLILDEFHDDVGWDSQDVEDVKFEFSPLGLADGEVDDELDDAEDLVVDQWIEAVCGQLIDRCNFESEIVAYDVSEEVNRAIQGVAVGLWLDEAVKAGVPSSARGEFVYFIGWPEGWCGGQLNLDCAIEELGLRYTNSRSTYLDELLPSQSLKSLMTYLNVGTDQFIEAVKARNPDEGQKMAANFAEKDPGGVFSVCVDTSRPQVLSPENLIAMIENAGSMYAVPVIHAYVDIGALFRIDPREMVALPLKTDRIHIGLHDFVSGAGYMDTYPGCAQVDLMTGGFSGDQYSYGINETYGLALGYFYCRPENVCVEDRDRERQRG